MKHDSANRLIDETSPYLLQHAYNPVDWFPWSEEALQLAKKRDCPILLSIGYSSCHWCHVMERESFENSGTAAIMNEHFVNIKVDREERPDLDAIYMNYVQLATGQGGWPLTVFLTPELIPFFGGTYFPPVSAHGRPGFKDLLANITHFYSTQRDKITEKKDEILASLERAGEAQFGRKSLKEDTLGLAAGSSLRQFDSKYGGFGHAPKFPSSMTLAFLLRWYRRTGNSSALNAVDLSLDSMARGGIYDQLGGGFHRYSVDERWLVPHFEKMLYDNALLARVYLEAYQIQSRASYLQVVEETLGYVRRDLSDPAGGFYSAEDADSEGEEGRFYVWSVEETESILGKPSARLFNDYYDVTAAGNWEGKSILNQRRELEGYAQELNLGVEELQEQLGLLRESLFEARTERVRPLLDDKVIASWNGLMLTAFAEAAAVLNRSDYLDVARKNARFLLEKMTSKGRLSRTWKQGRCKYQGYLDDYAHVVQGLISLYEVEGEICWLEAAADFMKTQLELFFDESSDDFYFTSTEHEKLPVRHKEFFDNAIPSGNSVSAQNLLRLAALTGDRAYEAIAERMLEKMSQGMQQYPLAFGNWLQAADFSLGPVQEIVVVGPAEKRTELMAPVRETFLPGKVIVQTDPSLADSTVVDKIPLLASRRMIDGKATAYLCENMACQEPTNDIDRFREQLQGSLPGD